MGHVPDDYRDAIQHAEQNIIDQYEHLLAQLVKYGHLEQEKLDLLRPKIARAFSPRSGSGPGASPR